MLLNFDHDVTHRFNVNIRAETWQARVESDDRVFVFVCSEQEVRVGRCDGNVQSADCNEIITALIIGKGRCKSDV